MQHINTKKMNERERRKMKAWYIVWFDLSILLVILCTPTIYDKHNINFLFSNRLIAYLPIVNSHGIQVATVNTTISTLNQHYQEDKRRIYAHKTQFKLNLCIKPLPTRILITKLWKGGIDHRICSSQTITSNDARLGPSDHNFIQRHGLAI